MDDAVAGLEGHAAALGDELRQGMVGNNINRLRVCRGVAEGLHDKRSGELQAGEVLELVAGHGSGGVLRADGGHLRLAVGARTDSGNAAGAADNLLRESIALPGLGSLGGLEEQV